MVHYWATFLRIAGTALYAQLADYLECGSTIWCDLSTGAATHFQLNPVTTLDGYRHGMRFQFRAHQQNGLGPCTAAVRSPTGYNATYDIHIGDPGIQPDKAAILPNNTITLVYREDFGTPFFDMVDDGRLISRSFADMVLYTPNPTSENGSYTIDSSTAYYLFIGGFFIFFAIISGTTQTPEGYIGFSYPIGIAPTAGAAAGNYVDGGSVVTGSRPGVALFDTANIIMRKQDGTNFGVGNNRVIRCVGVGRLP